MWGANEQRAWQSVLRIPGPDVVDVTPLWSRVDATCTGESLHIVIRPKFQKEYKGGDSQFPHFFVISLERQFACRSKLECFPRDLLPIPK